MLQRKNPEIHLVQRRKILLVGAEPSVQGLISTFLLTMGWTCTVVQNKKYAPTILQQEAVDAVVIDLGRSGTDAEQAILGIKQIRPSLGNRILVLNNGAADKEMLELMERHDLIQLSQEGLLPQLWAALEGFFAPARSRETALHSVQVPRMIFDSFRHPLPAGVRGSSPVARHLAYQYKKTVIDLSMELKEGFGRMFLAGQVLDGDRKSKLDGLSVLLIGGIGTLARTATNQFGEFHMECEVPQDASLEIRLGERSWVSIPLAQMGWTGKRTWSWPDET
jgi:CheY-like chemotaxis protein